jgi:hypothetical protein
MGTSRELLVANDFFTVDQLRKSIKPLSSMQRAGRRHQVY